MRKLETQIVFQIGKNGVTEGTLNSLDTAFKHHKRIRISVLKSATRNREELKALADKIQSSLKTKTVYKLIGYTIILMKR